MKISRNVDLSECTSFGTGGVCEVFAVAEKASDLAEIVQTQPKPFWILGSGANSLISDKGLPGTTIHIEMDDIQIEDGLVLAGSGTNWDDLVTFAISNNLWGLEHTSGIPGSVGAAVVGNIAAYGQAVSDTLQWIETIDLADEQPEPQKVMANDLDLEYRSSAFSKGNYNNIVITKAAFKLSNTSKTEFTYDSALAVVDELGLDVSTLEGRRKAIMKTRERAGSLLDSNHSQKTAGSFFKNPMVTPEQAENLMKNEEYGISKQQILHQNKVHGGNKSRVSAAHVLLAAGFNRGQAWGPVRIHPDHVLKIENTGGATSQQIYDVAMEIMNQVKSKLDIDLEPEVRFMGDFS